MKRKAISQSTIITTAIVVGVACCAANAVSLTTARQAQGDLIHAYDQRTEAIEALQTIRNSSAGLTRNVRYFVAYQDTKYLDMYWEEVNTTKSQEKALAKLTTLGVPADDLALMQQASALSGTLVQTETIAMRLALEAMDVPSSQMPATVAQTRLEPSLQQLSAEEKIAKAKDLVTNEAYDSEVSKIMAPIKEFQRRVMASKQNAVDQRQHSATIAGWSAVGAAVLMLVALIGSLLVIQRFMGSVVQRFTQQLDSRDPKDLRFRLAPRGVTETRGLAQSFNYQTEQVALLINTIRTGACELTEASTRLAKIAANLKTRSHTTQDQAISALQSTNVVGDNVSSVSFSSVQLGMAIGEVAEATTVVSQVAATAVEDSQSTQCRVQRLAESSQFISDVAHKISAVAGQINLLVLNAAIEATHVPEARSEVVTVADDVKELTEQTSVAAEDIAARVASIQQDAQAATLALSSIAQVIDRLSAGHSSVASTMEQQRVMTREISEAVSTAVTGINRIAADIDVVTQSAESTSQDAQSTQDAAEELGQMAQQFNDLVVHYTTD